MQPIDRVPSRFGLALNAVLHPLKERGCTQNCMDPRLPTDDATRPTKPTVVTTGMLASVFRAITGWLLQRLIDEKRSRYSWS
jgi:hypothetical protein